METALRAWLGEVVGEPVADVVALSDRRPARRVSRVRFPSGRTVIAKHLAAGVAAEPGEAAFIGNEAFALEALARHATSRVAPAVVAVSRDPVCVVYEDLGDRPTLAGVLLADDEQAATVALVEFAKTLGRVHADLASRVDELAALRDELPLATRPLGYLGDVGSRWQLMREALVGWGIEAPQDVEAEAAAVSAALADRRWATLIHGDACPDNMTIDPLVIFDWETADVGHALLDAAYLWMPFPTCWCAGAIPPEVLERAERAYRDAASATITAAADDEAYAAALDDAVAAWFIQSSVWGLQRSADADPSWGISTHRHRLAHRARVVRHRGERFASRYPALAALSASIVHAVEQRWPDAAPGLAPYPAFASSRG